MAKAKNLKKNFKNCAIASLALPACALLLASCGGGGGSSRLSDEEIQEIDTQFTYQVGDLGVTYSNGTPTLKLWAPWASSVSVNIYDSESGDSNSTEELTLNEQTGVWSITGNSTWTNKYYRFNVDGRSTTDPYSISLSADSGRSMFIDLSSSEWKPSGWDELAKPELNSFNDVVLYELHLRDFSISDTTVPSTDRGKYTAFNHADSNGMQHLIRLKNAGLTHVHLLPVFDITSIPEREADQATIGNISSTGSSETARNAVAAIEDRDAFNWGYDPWHFGAPEGSYSTNPNGGQRVLEFREMVKSLNDNGLRVIMDVVYNHTTSSGTGPANSVLDRVFPTYYYRFEGDKVADSSCCPNTAAENNMMEELMIQTLIQWAVDFKVDGFRFDLMGHHPLSTMNNIRSALDALTIEEHGVDGSKIYVYGEGWDFGEVENNALFVNAAQLNLGGSGIGSFNDRMRDAVRGGGPFSGLTVPGLSNATESDYTSGVRCGEGDILHHYEDLTRIGLVGSIDNYQFTNHCGEATNSTTYTYSGTTPAGYTESPIEAINYVSAHDNETLWDAIQAKAPSTIDADERTRMQIMGLSYPLLAQGIPFIHAGSEILRSKSLDRDSYNSGDWFNKLDYTYQTNNWAVGMPPHPATGEESAVQSALNNGNSNVTIDEITFALEQFETFLKIRRDSKLFRLSTASDINARVSFYNTGDAGTPGMIVMGITDEQGGATDLDSNFSQVIVLFNNTENSIAFESPNTAPWVTSSASLSLHPCIASGTDDVAKTAAYAAGTFTIPGRTASVFVENQNGAVACGN